MNLLILISVLSTLFSNLESKILQSDIALTMQAQGQAALTAPGSIVMQGEKFMGSAKGYEVAYDGKTFYLYDPDANEMMLTNPSREELLTTNPLLFAKSIAEVSEIKENVNKDSTITTITLVPKGTPDNQMRVTVKVKNDLPVWVEIKEAKSTTSLRLKNPQYITSAPAFILNKPGVYINDLR